jgi:hypothetical protein
MALVEPIIVVLGPRCGGTSAVAGVLRHLGVFMDPGSFEANFGVGPTASLDEVLCIRAV